MRALLKVIVSFSAVFVGSCTVKPDAVSIGPMPEGYTALIRDHVRKTFFDPRSIQDARLSLPEQGHLFFQQGWIICLEANAKNRMGGYVGLKSTAYLINRGEIIRVMSDAPVCESKNLFWRPFEYEKVSQ